MTEKIQTPPKIEKPNQKNNTNQTTQKRKREKRRKKGRKEERRTQYNTHTYITIYITLYKQTDTHFKTKKESLKIISNAFNTRVFSTYR